MNLGQKIYELRTAKNLSQGDLADLLDVSRQSVSKWENNTAVPELDKLIRLCDVFDVTLDELAGRERTVSVPSAPTPGTASTPQSPEQPISAVNSSQRVVGYILLTVSLLAILLFAVLAADPVMFILFVQPLLLCSIICLLVKRRAIYWCLWAIYLSAEFFSAFGIGLRILSTVQILRLAFMVIMIFVAWASFKNVTVPVTKTCKILTVLSWVAYAAASYALPRIYISQPEMQMFSYHIINSLLNAVLAALFTYTICLLKCQRSKR